MKRFFSKNITNSGRLFRGALSIALFIAGLFAPTETLWIPLTLTFIASFILFEALAGWCVVRACGVHTQI